MKPIDLNRFTVADFPGVLSTVDTSNHPHMVAVAGGQKYTLKDASFVKSSFAEEVRRQLGTTAFDVLCSPAQGAAAILYRAVRAAKQNAFVCQLDLAHGNAATFRTAWNMLAAADSVIVFEPLDTIANHLISLAKTVETRRGTGLPIVRIKVR